MQWWIWITCWFLYSFKYSRLYSLLHEKTQNINKTFCTHIYKYNINKRVLWKIKDKKLMNQKKYLLIKKNFFKIPKKNWCEKVFYIFSKKTLRKQHLLIFQERYIQNPDIFTTSSIFRTRGKFRTLSNIYDGTFCKNT